MWVKQNQLPDTCLHRASHTEDLTKRTKKEQAWLLRVGKYMSKAGRRTKTEISRNSTRLESKMEPLTQKYSFKIIYTVYRKQRTLEKSMMQGLNLERSEGRTLRFQLKNSLMGSQIGLQRLLMALFLIITGTLLLWSCKRNTKCKWNL